MDEQVEKSYNPFKMWGSYVVFVIISFIFFLLSITNCRGHSFSEIFFEMFNVGGPICGETSFHVAQILSLPMIIPMIFSGGSIFASFVSYILIGFLIGWGIHSLCRKYKK